MLLNLCKFKELFHMSNVKDACPTLHRKILSSENYVNFAYFPSLLRPKASTSYQSRIVRIEPLIKTNYKMKSISNVP